MRGLVTGAAGRTLVGVQRGEERVEPRARLGRADAAERGEDDGQKGATDVLAAGFVLVVLRLGPGYEDRFGVVRGGAHVGRAEGTGNGAVDGDDERSEVEGGDDDVDFGATIGARAEAFLRVDAGLDEDAGGLGDDVDE